MTGLCHRCGYFHQSKVEAPPTEEEIAEDTFREDVFTKLAEQLKSDRETRDRIDLVETKVEILLDILTATNDADRMGRVAKARSKLKKMRNSPLLESIRKANQESA